MESPQSENAEQEYEVAYLHKQEATAPTLVTFPQNIPPPYFLRATEGNADPIDLYLMKSQEHSRKNQRVLYGTNSKFEWIGKDYGVNTEKTHTSKYVLGIVDPVEKKIKLIEPDVFNLRQYLSLIHI
eukprot:TRINITY_DN13656_c0_g2_i2.p1 TRINITY_DN13656_c0_g2~~TRINITY_DN13656_c0_g2_i2.p1  ORF type:complete len:127 (+),score=21.03 TRINITY_DN13656_c0_g2_i2:113-493(+)